MKNILFPILALSIFGLLFLPGCSEPPVPPDQVVNKYWNLYNAGNKDEARTLIVEGRESELEITLFTRDDKPSLRDKLIQLYYPFEENIDFKAKGYEQEGEAALVNVSITKKNSQEALSNFYTKGGIKVNLEGISDVTHEAKAQLQLIDGEWKIYAWKFDILDERMDTLRNRFIDETLIKVEAKPDKGFHWPYFLSIPEMYIPENHIYYLLVSPNNTGTGHEDFQVHLNAAQREVNYRGWSYGISRGLKTPLLVPVFPRPYNEWWNNTHALNRVVMQIEYGPLKRLDLQLIAMIEDAQEKLEDIGLNMEEKVFMNGFSSSGWTSFRFTMFHPHMVRAKAVGGNFTQMLPIEELNGERLEYPVGVADLEQITGKAFDYDEYVNVEKFIYVGASDPYDTTYHADCFISRHGEQIRRLVGHDTMARWEKTQEIYQEQNIPAQFVTYEGVGHDITVRNTNDVIDFFLSVD